MKICTHKGLDLVVLTRNEHCPPHVHVGTERWDARFQFSFWHNGVRLWDVTPEKNEPSSAVLEELRQALKRELRRARELWWVSRNTACLENQQWDVAAEEVVSPQQRRRGALDIVAAHFDGQGNRTLLQLAGQPAPLEIQL